MRSRDLIIFFSVILIIYSAVNIFLFFRGASAFEGVTDKNIYTILFLLLSLSFPAGKILERNSSLIIADGLNLIGGFWLSFMLYSFIVIILSDLVILIINATGIYEINIRVKQIIYLSAFCFAMLLITAGFLNTIFPVVRRYNIQISKKASVRSIRIAAVSDIHLGSVIRRRSMRLLSEKLDSVKPDIVLLLGDIVDGEINPVLRDDLLKSLRLPATAKYIYAVTGNHEYIGGSSKTIPYIEANGIPVLQDEVKDLEEGIQIAGRTDRDSERYTGRKRKDLDELLKNCDHTRPVIILDHQPPYRKEDISADFDLMLSGHTHNGQMWPLNYLTGRLYKIKYGHKIINGSHYIVSSGFGSWGPRVRIGSKAEILDITLTFKD